MIPRAWSYVIEATGMAVARLRGWSPLYKRVGIRMDDACRPGIAGMYLTGSICACGLGVFNVPVIVLLAEPFTSSDDAVSPKGGAVTVEVLIAAPALPGHGVYRLSMTGSIQVRLVIAGSFADEFEAPTIGTGRLALLFNGASAG